ncbi:MAG: hypothetical protein OXU61_07395 [Gammaproteobacteria bacterium]|nr:hypothetical protein [Gammaproteobacteria bacterium]
MPHGKRIRFAFPLEPLLLTHRRETAELQHYGLVYLWPSIGAHFTRQCTIWQGVRQTERHKSAWKALTDGNSGDLRIQAPRQREE